MKLNSIEERKTKAAALKIIVNFCVCLLLLFRFSFLWALLMNRDDSCSVIHDKEKKRNFFEKKQIYYNKYKRACKRSSTELYKKAKKETEKARQKQIHPYTNYNKTKGRAK